MSADSYEDKTNQALVYASAHGNASQVAALLSHGARLDARYLGYTPFLAAVKEGNTEVCKLLLETGSDLEERMPDTQHTALHIAAVHGHIALCGLLISHKADVNSMDRTGFTPLHCASQEGHLASVVTLLQAGADPLLPNHGGVLPIHKAAQLNHPDVVKILIEQGGCSPDQVRHTAHIGLELGHRFDKIVRSKNITFWCPVG